MTAPEIREDKMMRTTIARAALLVGLVELAEAGHVCARELLQREPPRLDDRQGLGPLRRILDPLEARTHLGPVEADLRAGV